MDELWQKLQPQAVHYAGHIVGAALILILGWLVLRFLVGPLRRLLGRSRLDPSVASFLANSARTIILVVVILALLQQLGVQTTSLLTLLGAAGLAIGLALQNLLSNFCSGLSLLSFRTRRVVRKWRLPGGGSPDMGGVSADGSTLWLSGRYASVVYVISTRTGHLRADAAEVRLGLNRHVAGELAIQIGQCEQPPDLRI